MSSNYSKNPNVNEKFTIELPNIDDFDAPDKDSCTTEEIAELFTNRYIEVKKKQIKTNVKYSSLLASNHSDNIAIVSTRDVVSIISKETLTEISLYKVHNKDVSDITFSPQTSNVVYTGCLDGQIKLYDLRSSKVEKIINFNTEKRRRPVTCLDVSSHEKIICAGTDYVANDSSLMFWDLRSDQKLSGYCDCHSDDISKVKFHPDQHDTLASAGLDHLVNIFDVSQESEDDALTYCMNTEDVVNVLNWCSMADKKKLKFLAMTDVRSIQLWDAEEAAPSCLFNLESITKSMRRTASYECYAVNTQYSSLSKNPIVLTGSGLEHANNCLRTLRLNEESKQLEPHGVFVSENEKLNSVTQCAYYDDTLDSFLTVSEDGCLSWWKNTTTEPTLSLKSKPSGKSKLKKSQPY